MARVVKTEKMKKKNRKIKVLLFIIILVLLGVLGYFGVKKIFSKKDDKPRVEVVVLDSITEYGYNLSDNDSELFKKEYNVLKDLLNKDDFDNAEYSSQVAKLFIIDLYSLNTKINKYDIGGKEFFYSTKVLMYEQKVMDTIYETLQDNSYGDRNQQLPNVTSVEVKSTEEVEYTLNKEKVKGYQVKLTWTYDKDLGYDSKGTVVICKEDGGRWSVVDFQPTLEPKYK